MAIPTSEGSGDQGAHLAILRRLDDAGVEYEVLCHAPVYTMDDVARHIRVAESEKVKTLVLRARRANEERLVLCGIAGRARLDIKAVASHLCISRSRLAMVSPDEASEVLGVPRGAMGLVTPSPGPVVLLSRSFSDCEYVCFGAGRNDRTLRLRVAALSEVCEVDMVAMEV